MLMPKRLSSPRFLADAMLGSLARWLRILGLDCEYWTGGTEKKKGGGPGLQDDELLLKKAIKSKRILLTRDVRLCQKACDYCECLFLPNARVEVQAAGVVKKFGLKLPPKLSAKSICPKCGGKVRRVRKESVRGKVFPRVFAGQKIFRQCGGCGKVYWLGSHWLGILRQYAEIRLLAAS